MEDLLDGPPARLRNPFLKLFRPGPVDVRHRHDLDVGALGHLQELGQVVAPGDLSATDDADAKPVIRAPDPPVASRRESGGSQPASPEKTSTIEL